MPSIPLISGKYYLIEQEPRLNLSITDQWQSLDSSNLKPTNEPNIYLLSGHGSLYVGSTSDITMRRPKEHLRAFQRGGHQNDYMQAVWDKYGPFSYQVITVIPSDLVVYRDQIENAYIRRLDTFDNGYNMMEFADWGEKGRRKRSGHKSYRIIDPKGDIIEISNMTKWCADNGLDSDSIRCVALGKRTSHGYRPYCEEEVGKPYVYVRPPIRTYTVIDAGGKVIHIEDLKGFCRERNLSYKAFWHLATGKIRTSQGYSRA